MVEPAGRLPFWFVVFALLRSELEFGFLSEFFRVFFYILRWLILMHFIMVTTNRFAAHIWNT